MEHFAESHHSTQSSTYDLDHDFVYDGTDQDSGQSAIFGIEKRSLNFIDIFNLILFGGGGFFVLYHVLEEGETFGYMLTIVGILIFCTIFLF